jgi:hypothetical protein
MLPWLERARRAGRSVLVASPNLHCHSVAQRAAVYGAHLDSLFAQYVAACPAAAAVDVVAFSYGGVAFCSWLARSYAFAVARVRRVAFIDSAHSVERSLSSQATHPAEFQREWAFLQTHSRSWVKSHEPLNEPLTLLDGSEVFSAGTAVHDHTPNVALPAVFSWLDSTEAIDNDLMLAIASMVL